MKAKLVKTEEMVGVSKKTGNEYAIRKAYFLTDIPVGQTQKRTPDYTRTMLGSDVVECQVEEPLFMQIKRSVDESGFNGDYDLMFEQTVVNGQMRTTLIDCQPVG